MAEIENIESKELPEKIKIGEDTCIISTAFNGATTHSVLEPTKHPDGYLRNKEGENVYLDSKDATPSDIEKIPKCDVPPSSNM